MHKALFLCSLSAAALIGCAKGDDLLTGGGGSSGTESSAGGAGQTGSTTGQTTGGSTSTGSNCAEQPCKLVLPQCGCNAGEQCTLDASDQRACETAGSVSWGDSCNGGLACAPGTMCAGYAQDKLSCAKFCATDSDCEAPGGLCVITLNGGGGGQIPDVTLCSANCNLVSNAGCNVSGTSCQIGVRDPNVPYTLCAPSGTGVYQDICTDNSQCSPGHICLPTTANDDRCFMWCANGAGCTGGLTCQTLEISAGVPLVIGGTTYGACT